MCTKTLLGPKSVASHKVSIPSTPRITLMMGREVVDCHPSDMMVPPIFFIFGFSLVMLSSSSLSSVAGITSGRIAGCHVDGQVALD
jgi:hypothetical protein